MIVLVTRQQESGSSRLLIRLRVPQRRGRRWPQSLVLWEGLAEGPWWSTKRPTDLQSPCV